MNGNAYPGTLRRDQPKRAWEVPDLIGTSPLGCLADPFESAKLGEAQCLSPHLCVILRSQKRDVPDLGWRESQNYQEYTSMDGKGKRYIGLDVHKHYLVALGVDADLNVVLPMRRVELSNLESWMKKI